MKGFYKELKTKKSWDLKYKKEAEFLKAGRKAVAKWSGFITTYVNNRKYEPQPSTP